MNALDECSLGSAIDPLAQFENFFEQLGQQKQAMPIELARLREPGRTKSCKLKELLAQKVMVEMRRASLAHFEIE